MEMFFVRGRANVNQFCAKRSVLPSRCREQTGSLSPALFPEHASTTGDMHAFRL